ncbi:hypothetical protein [Pseudomonas syringae]|nr:hypothetical protein [Pseudomonas syringae]MCF5197139.1 hypothetical protein [Pseudomonas syringae]MCF5208406.1 hypothetical protein [Pseudomonas syringae]MCF5212647.1 hypothetical protein [Pseudomonas syringae]MCF5220255.1 hypothetical protein [Pseudomonas syringae]MCF5263585.1 hypothetical protein [Pseudomonas syringae]
MQAGKIYRLRPVGSQMFSDGYLQNNCFYEGGSHHVGDVEADGTFRYRVKLSDGTPKFPDYVAGHVDGLTLTRVDGTVFELIEQAE